MSSLVTLDRMPMLGFNSEYRLQAAFAQQPHEKACFFKTKNVSELLVKTNIGKAVGCLPGICILPGVARLYVVYMSVYGEREREKVEKKERIVQDTISLYSDEQKNNAAAWLQDRKWTLIKIGALGIAEICHLTVVLAAAHILKTAFDHIVAACNQPATDSREYGYFQHLIEQPAN